MKFGSVVHMGIVVTGIHILVYSEDDRKGGVGGDCGGGKVGGGGKVSGGTDGGVI